MFKKIKSIDSLAKPDIFSFTVEQFEQELKGEKNLHLRIRKELEKEKMNFHHFILRKKLINV